MQSTLRGAARMSKMAPHVDVPRIDRLLRSVVGVTDLHFARGGASGSVTVVHVLRALHVQHHQIVRNIVSALQAAFDIDLEHRHVHVHDTEDSFVSAAQQSGPALGSAPRVAALPAPAMVSLPTAAPASLLRIGNGQANGDDHGNGNGAAASAIVASNGKSSPAAASPAPGVRSDRIHAEPRPLGEALTKISELAVRGSASGQALQLERIDFEHHGVTARCRVQLTRGSQGFSAVAEAPDGPTAEAELAARVALDALRAAGLSTAELQGVGLVTLANTSFVVASVRKNDEEAPLAGAAPLVDSIAWSAAAAVLSAAGWAVSDRAPVPVAVRRHETRTHNQIS